MSEEKEERSDFQQLLDASVLYLTEHPDQIRRAWSHPALQYLRGGVLFQYCTPTGKSFYTPEGHDPDDTEYGCLTQVKSRLFVAFREDITEAIRADNRIPTSWESIVSNPSLLLVFAEWQMRIATWTSENIE